VGEPLFVGGRQPPGDLPTEVQGLPQGQGTAVHPFAESLPFEQLHDQEGHSFMHSRVVDLENVRV